MAVEHEEWVRRDLRWYRIHLTAVANERKVIQILYIRLWYSTIQYELIAHQKLSEALRDAVTEKKDKSDGNQKHQIISL